MLIDKLIETPTVDSLWDAFELCRDLEERGMILGNGVDKFYDEENFKTAHEYAKRIRTESAKLAKLGIQEMAELNKKCLLFDAPWDFDAAFRYAEWNRPVQKRFYEPRRKQLLPAARAMQRLEERKVHRLLLMCPPGIGKALANDTPVLTSDGWKNHGDLKVGDKVIGLDGKFKEVLAVHPKCMVDRLVEFTDGEKIVCHENHEWMVWDKDGLRIMDTKSIERHENPGLCVPIKYEREHLNDGKAFKSVSRVEPVEGNCITVEGGMYLAGKHLTPTHNSTLAIGFMVWTGMKHPELPILGVSHNNEFLFGAYQEIVRMLDPEGEYLWHEIFPKVRVTSTNAKNMRIDLDTRKRFETFEFSSIGSGNAGKVRAMNLLYCDDLVDGFESAISRDRMDKLWNLYNTDALQRMQGDCAELVIQTPWSLHDPIDRLEQMFRDDPDTEIIKFPALDEEDESNFDYPYGLGFTTKQYHDKREIMDDISWRSLYMCEPMEREGQLYSPEELMRYSELPDREADVVFAVCDTKETGPDYCAMPVVYKYGEEYFIDAFICDNGNPEVIEERIAQTLVDRRVKMARFESNRGGTLFAKDVQDKVKEKGGQCKVTTKWNQTNKETRIITRAGWVKDHCLFLDDAVANKEYRKAVEMLCSYNMAGKNKHDDVPDVLADLADYAENMGVSSLSVRKRLF